MCHLAPCVHDLSLLNQNTTQYRAHIQLQNHHFAYETMCIDLSYWHACKRANGNVTHNLKLRAHFKFSAIVAFRRNMCDKPNPIDLLFCLFVCLLEKKIVCARVRVWTWFRSIRWFYLYSFDLLSYLFVLLHRESFIHNNVRK